MPRNEFVCDCHPIDEALVSQTKATMPENATFQSLAQLFHIIGDPTRCKILFALKQSPMCVCDLANVLSMTKSSISHQLNKLKSASVVKCEKSGKQVFYSLDDHHIFAIFDTAVQHIRHNAPEVSR